MPHLGVVELIGSNVNGFHINIDCERENEPGPDNINLRYKLPRNINPNTFEASLSNGILTIIGKKNLILT
ncbi:hypothetical protein Mgra_00001085 [Meloidogyne graminicola]|uniref:SHSP domain-containing protein n=1 Tax=Meloidogyne graminicola TaxID=189291 RepID=A0A8T0A340_9BILA|nr:hypothetical protein Mgra_00001085 [Meloidogyne graminicola]